MKKIILYALLTAMAIMFAACGGKEYNKPSETQTQHTEEDKQIQEQLSEHTYIKTELTVEGMSCNNCVNAIKKEVLALDGVKDVLVDLKKKKVTVEHNSNVTVNDIKESIMSAGYSPFD